MMWVELHCIYEVETEKKKIEREDGSSYFEVIRTYWDKDGEMQGQVKYTTCDSDEVKTIVKEQT